MKLFAAQKSPKLHKLKQLQRETTQLRKRLHTVLQRGLTTADDTVAELCANQASELTLELATHTWDSLALQLDLAQELPSWSPPIYYYAADVGQWAKVRALPSGRFVFEALSTTQPTQGVLLELAMFERLAAWQPCTREQYQAALDAALEQASGIWWNGTVPQPDSPK